MQHIHLEGHTYSSNNPTPRVRVHEHNECDFAACIIALVTYLTQVGSKQAPFQNAGNHGSEKKHYTCNTPDGMVSLVPCHQIVTRCVWGVGRAGLE